MEASGTSIRLAVVLRFVDVATDALAGAREEIDALNVYPIPDGDTGTNMYLTVSAARDAIREATGGDARADRRTALAAFSRGALLGARGNSGVILSEMLGAIARRIDRATPDERHAVVMADALRLATDASYAAVGVPVEGTMLTVSRAASDAASEKARDPKVRARDVFTAAAAAAREALGRTTEQLQALADAGVVDAGGRGLSVILDAAETVLTGRRPIPVTGPARQIPVLHSVAHPGHSGQSGHPGHSGHHLGGTALPDLEEGGPSYEVMYLLDSTEERVAALRHTLGRLGDSLVVVGGDGLWNVHVHVDDVGAAVEAGIEAGRPHRIRVTHFADQLAAQAGDHAGQSGGHRVEAAARPARTTARAVVAVAAGPGLAQLFADAGAVVVQGGPGGRPSTGQLLEAIVGSGASEVVVLPNDHDSVRVAQIAARTAEEDAGVRGPIRVAVIPTRAQVQGLAALAVHEPGRGFDQDVLEMTATARHARQGAVTIAARQAMTMAGPCEPGDALGVIEGDFAVVGHDLFTVATDVLERMLGAGGDLVSIVAGREDAEGVLATRCAGWVEARHPGVDVVVYDGGQQRYPLLMSVE